MTFEAGQEIEYGVDRFGYHFNSQRKDRVTSITGTLPKGWAIPWASKLTAEYAVENWDALSKMTKRERFDLIKGATNRKRDDAADRGTVVHNAIESYLGHTAPDPHMTMDECQCVASAIEFLTARKSEVLGVEVTVFSELHGYAGTVDLWDSVDGESWLLDWKTSGAIYPEYGIQLTAYQHAEWAIVDKVEIGRDKWVGKLIEWGPHVVPNLGVVHVQPDGTTFRRVMPNGRWWDQFRACLHTKHWARDTDMGPAYRPKNPRDPIFGPAVELRREPQPQEAA